MSRVTAKHSRQKERHVQKPGGVKARPPWRTGEAGELCSLGDGEHRRAGWKKKMNQIHGLRQSAVGQGGVGFEGERLSIGWDCKPDCILSKR